MRLNYDEWASDIGSLIIPDCGLAPGLPNLIIGNHLNEIGGLPNVSVYVGGVAANKAQPYGYVNTWSLDDLLEEYTRTARVVENRIIRTKHPLYTQPEMVRIKGMGTMEAFYSDGLRSLLSLKNHIPNLKELTLRWPGHMYDVHRLIDQDMLIQEFKEKCNNSDYIEDIVALVVKMPNKTYTLIDKATGGVTAMARTTAFTCAGFVDMVLSGECKGMVGVKYPEDVADGTNAFAYIRKFLADRGVKIEDH